MNEPQGQFKYVFGPVLSRRLGWSLGVDLVPHKVCTYDCVYCQLGGTTRKTSRRKLFAPVEGVIAEVKAKLPTVSRPDYITLAGSGEPTLHAGIGQVIRGIKAITDVPVDVLTNGSLFHKPRVREDCLAADLALPTLDAGDEETFRRIHRPAPGFTLDRIVGGLEAFRKEFRGEIWLEVFLIKGVNSSPEQVSRMLPLIARISPERIQLNTAVRPTAEPDVRALSEAELAELCGLFGRGAEVIADFKRPPRRTTRVVSADDLLAVVRRHPAALGELAIGLGLEEAAILPLAEELRRRKLIVSELRAGRKFLRAL